MKTQPYKYILKFTCLVVKELEFELIGTSHPVEYTVSSARADVKNKCFKQ